ncbi:MAG: hypothetical protein II821_01010 [Treponema sp.]|nr:hypothetical protein [Treponema sp.]
MNKFLLLPLSFLTFSLFSQEIKFSGEAGTVWARALRSENQGDFVLGDTYLNGKLEVFHEKSSVYAESRAGFDEVSDETYYDLKEIWLDYTTDFWGFRIGRQKSAWGKADGIDITNVICPPDYSSNRTLLNDDYLGIDSLRLSFTGESLTLDAYFIPFFKASPLPAEKSKLIFTTTLPEKNLNSAEYGIKLSGYFSLLDISLYGFYGWEDTPFLSYSPKIENGTPAGVEINADYRRMTMFGLDAAVPLGELVFRAETAFFPGRNFQKSAAKIITEKSINPSGESVKITEKHENLLALAGLDWMPDSWTFTAQYFCNYLCGSTENLDRSRTFTHGATLSLSKSLFSETLKLSASGVLMLNDFDSVIEFSGEYSLSDDIFLEAGSWIFSEGKEKGTYGEYKNLTSAYLKARYVF